MATQTYQLGGVIASHAFNQDRKMVAVAMGTQVSVLNTDTFAVGATLSAVGFV